MAEVTSTVSELFHMSAQILGWQENGVQVIPGFAREPELTEGTKRKAKRIGDIFNKEVAEIRKQLAEIDEYKEEGLSEEELAKVIQSKKEELLNDTITIGNIELLDFSKIEDISFKSGYSYHLLYDKIFTQ